MMSCKFIMLAIDRQMGIEYGIGTRSPTIHGLL